LPSVPIERENDDAADIKDDGSGRLFGVGVEERHG